MEKKLPPIFKVASNKIPDNNKKYYYSEHEKKKEIEVVPIKKDEEEGMDGIDEKINSVFKTKGYAFNIPVEITFAGKTIDTYLATRTNSSIITLDNETIPISTITNFEIKNPID